jgi:hypothetical protein
MAVVAAFTIGPAVSTCETVFLRQIQPEIARQTVMDSLV